MSAELIDQSDIPTMDSRVSDIEMALAEGGEGTLALRYRNARKMLEAFYNSGTPDEVIQALSLTTEEAHTAIDDAQSLYDDLPLHIIPLKETPLDDKEVDGRDELSEGETSDTIGTAIVLTGQTDQHALSLMKESQLTQASDEEERHFLPAPVPEIEKQERQTPAETHGIEKVTTDLVIDKLGEIIGDTGSLGALLSVKRSRVSIDSAVHDIQSILRGLPSVASDELGMTRGERVRLLQLAGLRINQKVKTGTVHTGKELVAVSPITMSDIKAAARKGGHSVVDAEQDGLRALLKLFGEYDN